MSGKRDIAGKRPHDRGRRRFLAWNGLLLFSFLLGRRREQRPADESSLPGREARYYRKVGGTSGRTG